jgi:rubredoxin
MSWKQIEDRRAWRRKRYAELRESGHVRDWGMIEAICPVCGEPRWISKNRHGITKVPQDGSGRVIARCKSCARRKDFAPSYTNQYSREKGVERRIDQKQFSIQHLGGKCLDCGLVYDGSNGYAFDFHHRDPATKRFQVGSKYDLLCAICHRKRHSLGF